MFLLLLAGKKTTYGWALVNITARSAKANTPNTPFLQKKHPICDNFRPYLRLMVAYSMIAVLSEKYRQIQHDIQPSLYLHIPPF